MNETVGKHRLNTPTVGKSEQFVEWLASRGLKHVDSHCTCGRRGGMDVRRSGRKMVEELTTEAKTSCCSVK